MVSLPAVEERSWTPEVPRFSAPPAKIRSSSDELQFGSQATGAIAGTITASDTGRPVANARVYVYEWNRGRYVDDALYMGAQDTAWAAYGRRDLGSAAALTAADGTFTLPALAAGRYRFRATAPGFGGIDVPFVDWFEGRPAAGSALTVSEGATTTLKNVALPRMASLTGVVRDDRGRPIVDAGISIQTASGRILMTLRTDDKGYYAAGGLQPGAFKVMAQVNRRSLPITTEADVTDPMKRSNSALVVTGDYIQVDLDLRPGEAKNLDFTLTFAEKVGAPGSR
jgi:protocatechuate 3,4-dioxygenase beta subunit